MTKEDLIQKLNKIASTQGYCPDQESDHVNADQLLLDYINDDEVTKAFESIQKCYA